MLYQAKTLEGHQLNSRDGEIGKVKDFYFDDRHWTIRYLVAETGHWLKSRQVLISPHVLGEVNYIEKDIVVELTKKQIEGSPSLDSDKPISRQFEETYYEYYGLPLYWGGSNAWGDYTYPVRNHTQWSASPKNRKTWDAHLRSSQEVSRYHIHAADGEIGHIDDFIIDDETWAIRYLIVSTRNWWPGKKVLISPQWVESVDWANTRVSIDLTRETVKQSPEYTETSLLNRDYETRLYLHYNRPGYWVNESVAK